MSQKEGVLAIIPAKGNSERLSRKNLRLLAGRPIISYTIEAALNSGVFSEVCVTTEDENIARMAKECGASVPFVRPKELSTSTVRLVDVLQHTLDFYSQNGQRFPIMARLLVTSPLRTAEDIRKAYDHFEKSGADALITYSEFDHSPYLAWTEENGMLHPIYPEVAEKARMGRHMMPTPYRDNGAALFIRTEVFQRVGEYYVDNTAGWYLPPPNGLDIDTEHDLLYAEQYLAQNRQNA
jgi:CMP-N-acetylneuraminic acid synthetase